MVELNSGNNAVTTLAGSTTVNGSANGVGTNATFNTGGAYTWITSLALSGNTLFVADTANCLLRAITLPTYAYPSTTYTFSNLLDNTYTVSNYTNGVTGYLDGSIAIARFSSPQGIAVNSVNGNMYVLDTGNYVIRMITPAGIVSTIAGTAGTTARVDGNGTAARFKTLSNIVINSTATSLYLHDDNYIRTVDLASGNYTVSTSPYTDSAYGLCIDPTNTYLYVATYYGNTVVRVTISSWATSVIASGFTNPTSICIDSIGSNLYVADFNAHRIKQIRIATSTVTTIVGNGTSTWNGDGNGTSVQLANPLNVTINASNTALYITQYYSIRMIELVSGNYTVTTIEGTTAPPYGQYNYTYYGYGCALFWHPAQNILYYSDPSSQIKTINYNVKPNSNVQIKNATGVPITIAGTGNTVVRNSNIYPSLSATDVALLQNTNGNVYTIY